ncbi:MAG: hypothetical protein M3346_03905, partial [Actinomycetota bacterium]|nr:hypothetical protein [Actinomycetota bacterium]
MRLLSAGWVLLILLAGCQQIAPQTPPLRDPKGLDQKPDVDACSLVTQPEAEAVLGEPVVRDDGGRDSLVCSYSGQQASPSGSVRTMRINVTGPYDSGIEFVLAAYGGAKGPAPEDEIQTVEGVGHHALWVHGSSETIWVLRGPVGVSISLASAGIADDAARLETATGLARSAVERLPEAPDPDQSLAEKADPNAAKASLSGEWKTVHTLTEFSPGQERPEGFTRDRTDRTLWAPKPDCRSGPCDVNINYFSPDGAARAVERYEYAEAGIYRRAQIFPGVANCIDSETNEVRFNGSHDRTVTTKFVVSKAGGNEALVLEGTQTWVDRPTADFQA